ncbi:DUF3397 domain-containing protein [Sediminibacillus massiliensis]|uniref:DUF3397 domain-containing protein n=1 Tax=Sediminibacillus massiliensis TaxID=1926277 RepID=UPI00098869E4|nr:DUF3397 domain-containing protein [Sediminibacillus massiliensis]
MIEIIAYLTGVIVTVPVVITFLIYFSSAKLFRNKWKAIHTTVNYSTLIYIISVGTLLQVITGRSYFGYIFVLLIVLLAASVFIQWKTKEEIIFRHAWKVFWRFSFLLFFAVYFGLVFLGLAKALIDI